MTALGLKRAYMADTERLGVVEATATQSSSHLPLNDQFQRPTLLQLQKTLADHFGGRAELHRQAQFALSNGSAFVAAVLEAGERQLDQAPRTAALIANWPGDPATAAIAMRFNAALHALARRGDLPALTALYRGEHDDFDGAIAATLRQHDETIALALKHPTQTNEVGRAAALLCALMAVRQDADMPIELLELGSSCGLNLNLEHYAYQLNGQMTGQEQSRVRIAPEWRGAPPPFATVEIRSARGVDLNPQDVGCPATAERMLSFIWADQKTRLERLSYALEIARQHRPRVDRGHAATWLREQLAEAQPEGICRVVFHSMVLQYCDADERRSIIDSIRGAGEYTDSAHPLAWISFEWTPSRSEVRLLLTCWPGGGTRHLATCHPYGAWLDWHAEKDQPVEGCPDDLIARNGTQSASVQKSNRHG